MKKQTKVIILVVVAVAILSLSILLLTKLLSKGGDSIIDENGQLIVGNSIFDFSETRLSGSEAVGTVLSHTDHTIPRSLKTI